MIIANTPIGRSIVDKAVKGWINDLKMLNSSKNVRQFNFVYFSYRPDYSFLYLSVKTLIRYCKEIRKIYVFVDQKAPFSETEEKELKALDERLTFKKIYNFSWASSESTMAEFDAFLDVCEECPEGDFVAKVDSDILFFESSKLSRIARSNLLSFGDGHWDNYEFYQGGLYIIDAQLLRRVLAKVTLEYIDHIVGNELNNNQGEDRVISHVLRSKNELYYTHLMLFPSEYSRLSKLNRFVRWDYCAMHFIRDKNSMPLMYQKFCRQ